MVLHAIAKSCWIRTKNITREFLMVCSLSCLTIPVIANVTETPKAVWYRYYDNNGIANISTSVTPAHIRYGYEALDQNMQVIQRSRPYNVDKDIKQAPQRAVQAREREQDLKLKRAYTNSRVAQAKRDEHLANLKKQLSFQQDQLRQLQSDRIYFKRQEMDYLRKGQPVPPVLKNSLNSNYQNIVLIKNNITSLQTNYRNTQAQYDRIISRLKAIE